VHGNNAAQVIDIKGIEMNMVQNFLTSTCTYLVGSVLGWERSKRSIGTLPPVRHTWANAV
jgi:hypothetical protein